MKHYLLILFIAFTSFARANDTLTRAQIYNFNVGDTFDYEEHNREYPNCPIPGVLTLHMNNYTRCVIHQIYYSTGSDTLYVVRNWVYPLPAYYDTLIIDSLQYPADFWVDSMDNRPSQFLIDSNSNYNHRILNQVTLSWGGFGWNYIAGAQGLGKVFIYNVGGECGSVDDSLYLIYYAKGTEIWGKPYYVADQSYLVHFTPIPEECATWISVLPSICNSAIEEIKTGNRIANNGHTFVEMKYSGQNFYNGNYTFDSIIGYFRNDTLNRKVYLYYNINSSPFLTYDFSIPADSFILSLGQVNVGGQLRTIWGGYYIEGLGSIEGIYPFSCSFTDGQGNTITPGSNLTCFSVCGQTLYPYDSTANCSLVGINNLAPTTTLIKVFPTINDGTFNVELLDQSIQTPELVITDITGREIKRCRLNNQLSNINIQSSASGLYLWRVVSDDRLLQAGKLVKE